MRIIILIALFLSSCNEKTENSPCNYIAERPIFRFFLEAEDFSKNNDFTLYYEFSNDSIIEYTEIFIEKDTFEIDLDYSSKFILSNLSSNKKYIIEASILQKEVLECGVKYSRSVSINNSLICNDCDLNSTYHVK